MRFQLDIQLLPVHCWGRLKHRQDSCAPISICTSILPSSEGGHLDIFVPQFVQLAFRVWPRFTSRASTVRSHVLAVLCSAAVVLRSEPGQVNTSLTGITLSDLRIKSRQHMNSYQHTHIGTMAHACRFLLFQCTNMSKLKPSRCNLVQILEQ